MSDSERRGRSKERRIHKRYRSKLYPVISDSREADDMSPESFREFCDYCMQPLKPARRKGFGPGRRKVYGRPITFVNADKLVRRRHLAELALKFFNDHKSTSFKLVKVCKINIPCLGHYGLTFTAQEDGVKECLVFRGVVYEIRGTKEALFCEIKDDDVEITLRCDDDDYVGSERPLRNKMADSGDDQSLSPNPVNKMAYSGDDQSLAPNPANKMADSGDDQSLAPNPVNKMADSGDDQSLAPNPVDSERRGRSKERHNRKRSRSKLSPVISDSREADDMSPESFREFCDYCMQPLKPARRKGFGPGQRKVYGRSITCVNADKLVRRRHLAELALKFFNEHKSTSFKLVKVCKINRPAPGYYGLTFTAQDDGVKECLVFRGVVYEIRGTSEALFCEIKDDDVEITLRCDDDDYVGSERACESED